MHPTWKINHACPAQSVTRKLGKICAGLIYNIFDFQVTKERLQLERHLQIANDSLQRNNGVDLQKYITLEQSNQVSFCEFSVRFYICGGFFWKVMIFYQRLLVNMKYIPNNVFQDLYLVMFGQNWASLTKNEFIQNRTKIH